MLIKTTRPGTEIEPDAGAYIASLASHYANTDEIRSLASSIVSSAPAAWRPADYNRAARTLYGTVKRWFRFVPDRGEYLLGFDDVRDPSRWFGDCDDAVIILGSLMASVGIPCSVLVMGDSAGPYHAALRGYGKVYDPTGVITWWNKNGFKVWGEYPIEEE